MFYLKESEVQALAHLAKRVNFQMIRENSPQSHCHLEQATLSYTDKTVCPGVMHPKWLFEKTGRKYTSNVMVLLYKSMTVQQRK